ncbi:MAG: hypothetical protein Q9210_005892 [Variospora velana]
MANPMEPTQSLKSPSHIPNAEKEVHPQKETFDEDSTLTKAEKIERHGGPDDGICESPPKRIKIENLATKDASMTETTRSERRKGVAPIKAESVMDRSINSKMPRSMTMMLRKEQPTYQRRRIMLAEGNGKKSQKARMSAVTSVLRKTK